MSDANTTAEAREELRKTLEGYMTDSIGAALAYLRSGDAAELLTAAEMDGMCAANVLRELTGVSA